MTKFQACQRSLVRKMMSKKLSFYGLVIVATLCIFFLVSLNHRYSNYLDHRMISDIQIRPRIIKYQDPFANYIKSTFTANNITHNEIQDVLDSQRRFIERDMEDYVYPRGRYQVNASKLSDLVMEKGGTPVRSVILSTWRSGSTFLGDILNAHPANFYHYEPLLDFGIIQIREPPLSDEAVDNLESMFKCDYSNLDRYLSYGKSNHPWVFNHNTHLWKHCQGHKKICWDPRFVSKFCRLFPFQSMKIVRLRLALFERILEQKSLGVKVVLLIRDPRGVLQSRKHREWCPNEPDCFNPAALCDDMVADYFTAIRFSRLYPHTFRVMRYEDLSVEPYDKSRELFDFYGLYFHDDVIKFLDTHTTTDIGGLSSTFRNSKAAPFHWRNDLDFDEVDEIQKECDAAMRYWGYAFAMNASHLRYLDPVTNYSLQGNDL